MVKRFVFGSFLVLMLFVSGVGDRERSLDSYEIGTYESTSVRWSEEGGAGLEEVLNREYYTYLEDMGSIRGK